MQLYHIPLVISAKCKADESGEMAKGTNKIGHFIERLVGTNNLEMPFNYKKYLDEALKYQSSILNHIQSLK